MDRRGWKLKLPATPVRLEDERLLDYRYPSEYPKLALSAAALAVLVVGAVLLEKREIVLAVAGIWATMVVVALRAGTHNMMRGAEVTPTQFPEIYRTLQELRQRFQAPAIRVFVIRKMSVQAETFGFRAPYVIVLPSLLLDSVNEQQLRYVIGRELGHIRFGHQWKAILFGGDTSTLPAILSWIGWLRDLLFAGYSRAKFLTADRAGILACGSVRIAIRTEIKLAIGNNQARAIREEDLIEQAYALTQGTNRISATLIRLQSHSPLLIPRLEAMVEWAGFPPWDNAHDEQG